MGKMDEDAHAHEPVASASAYQYTAAHLRQSSINRIDLNDTNARPAASTYSHVFNEHQHATNLNRDNLEEEGQDALFAEQGHQGMHRHRHRQSSDSNLGQTSSNSRSHRQSQRPSASAYQYTAAHLRQSS